MKFAIGLDTNFISAGFETSCCRHSIDRIEVIMHLKFAEILIPDIETNDNYTIYHYLDEELKTLLSSEEWTPPQEEEVI